MPIYEYVCAHCENRFERLQRLSDPPADRCPGCGGSDVHKVYSVPAIQFKGTGWYVTDYGRSSSSGPSKAEDKAPKPKAESHTGVTKSA